jgi:hypothetical protein
MNVEVFAQSVSSDVKNGYGVTIPWEMILDIVMQIVDKCFNNVNDFQQASKSPTVLQKAAMRNAVRKQNPNLRWKEANLVAEQIFAQAESMEPAQLEACYHEVKAANNPIDYDMGV